MNFHSFNQKRNEENCRLCLRDNGRGFSRDLHKGTGMIVRPHRNREKAEHLYQQYFIGSDKRKERRGALKLTTTTWISTLEGVRCSPSVKPWEQGNLWSSSRIQIISESKLVQ